MTELVNSESCAGFRQCPLKEVRDAFKSRLVIYNPHIQPDLSQTPAPQIPSSSTLRPWRVHLEPCDDSNDPALIGPSAEAVQLNLIWIRFTKPKKTAWSRKNCSLHKLQSLLYAMTFNLLYFCFNYIKGDVLCRINFSWVLSPCHTHRWPVTKVFYISNVLQ